MQTAKNLTTIYSSHAVYLNKLATKLGNDATPYLESIEKRITEVLSKLPNKTLSTKEVAAARAEINRITSEELQAYTTQYKADNKIVGQHQAAFDAKTLDNVTTGYESSIPSAGIINTVAIKAPLKVGDNQYTTYNRYINTYWKKYADMINDTVTTGFITGGTNREIASRILEQITLGVNDGDLAKAQRAAKTMARTATNHYATQATVAFVDKNDDAIVGYRFIATLDNRTSKQCSALDQEIFDKDDNNLPLTPLHPNCRSRLIYEVNPKYKYDDSTSTRPSNFTDADNERDPKRVSSKKTYYEAVKAMNKADRAEILGPQLGAALGKMDSEAFAKSLIDSTYEPLSIVEMKAKSDNAIGIVLRNMGK